MDDLSRLPEGTDGFLGLQGSALSGGCRSCHLSALPPSTHRRTPPLPFLSTALLASGVNPGQQHSSDDSAGVQFQVSWLQPCAPSHRLATVSVTLGSAFQAPEEACICGLFCPQPSALSPQPNHRVLNPGLPQGGAREQEGKKLKGENLAGESRGRLSGGARSCLSSGRLHQCVSD